MEALAASLSVPPDMMDGFAEVYACQGARGAKNYKALLQKVRSNSEVLKAIEAMASELPPLDDKAKERLVFCGRYAAKAGTPLDQSLRNAAADVAAAAATKAACTEGKIQFAVKAAKFGDEHLACRKAAFPYSPSVSASHGSPVLEARASTAVSGAVAAGELLGYVAMEGGGYVDDIGVFPKFHGQGVASGLLAACAKTGGPTLSLDVRAANVPAIKLYTHLGFQFGELGFPGFLDWDGGLDGQADSKAVLARKPANCEI